MSDTQRLRVTDRQAEARDIVLIELRAPDNAPLPPFTPGAHLEISLPNGLVRHYSLANDCRETDRYLVGVARVEDSRGGSDYVHRHLQCGAELTVSHPRNNFPLEEGAAAVFIAGGIGITPIMSMIRRCAALGRPWRLHYAARSRQRAAFYETLCALDRERVEFHFDDEAERVLDVARAVDSARDGEVIYCCGPAAMMAAVATATADRLPGSVRFEYFTAPDSAVSAGEAHAFTVVLGRSGASYDVPPGKGILDVLEENGHALPFSCREGLCGTCETKLLDGTPDHHDYVLSDEERAAGRSMMICVSRARSDRIVLDL